MTERIQKLTDMTLRGEMYVSSVPVTFDPADEALPRIEREVKRLCEYIRAQEPKITPYSALTGFFRFDGSVVGDAFKRGGHTATGACLAKYYLKPIDNLSTMEWQHATADYRKVLCKGIRGIIDEIDASLAVHSGEEERAFLLGLRDTAEAMIDWAGKCASRAAEAAKTAKEDDVKSRLWKLSDALSRVPAYAPTTFYEAVLCIYVCFSADPDSFGTLDRYLHDFYEHDLTAGILTREEAAEYLQELFLMVQAATPVTAGMFTRGGESHFCIGGYLPNGEDGFHPISRLITEALIDLPTYIPQITLRWTKKTAREDFRYMMDMRYLALGCFVTLCCCWPKSFPPAAGPPPFLCPCLNWAKDPSPGFPNFCAILTGACPTLWRAS